jgi:uncharacterized protein (TIGR02145 family)
MNIPKFPASRALILLLSVSACTTEKPMVTTDAVVGAHPKAYVSYTVMAEDEVFTSGVCYGTMTDPDLVTGTCTLGDRGIGTFTDTIAGLQNGTLYHVRAYATSGQGTVYGNNLTITSRLSLPGNGVSMDGHLYSTIVLGNGQEWMAENLRTGIYANGDAIPNVSGNFDWISTQGGAWSYYDNAEEYEALHGKLYNWYAVSDLRGLCPSGWHVPTDADWNALIGYIDPYFDSIPPPPFENGNGVQSSVAGGMLKSIGTELWQNPNNGGSDTIGFSAVPSGLRNYEEGGYFGEMGSGCYLWSSSISVVPTARLRYLSYDYAALARFSRPYGVGLSVRCVKNQ